LIFFIIILSLLFYTIRLPGNDWQETATLLKEEKTRKKNKKMGKL
jgi:hypothetical protein